MADETRVNYIITVRSEGGGGSGGSKEAGSRADTAGGKKKGWKWKEHNAVENANHALKLAPVAYALRMADSVATNMIGRTELRTGNALLQQKIEFTQGCVKSGLAIGAMLGVGLATANPLLVFGAAASAVNKVVEVEQRHRTLNLERQVESVGIGMSNIRAGANGSRG